MATVSTLMTPPLFPATTETLSLKLDVLLAGASAASENLPSPLPSLSHPFAHLPSGQAEAFPMSDAKMLDPAFHVYLAEESVRKLAIEPHLDNANTHASAPKTIPPTVDMYCQLMEVHDAAKLPISAVRLAAGLLSSEFPVEQQQGVLSPSRLPIFPSCPTISAVVLLIYYDCLLEEATTN
jgi:hypothetical protein